MDRRILRTRTAIFNAVLELLVEKDANKITVLEVCKKADINKSTFYLHYSSMADCLQKCFQAVMNGVADASKKIKYDEIKKNPLPAVESLLNEVEKNIDYLSRFSTSDICGPISKIYKDSLIAHIAESNGFTLEDNYFEYATISFCVCGCYDTIINMLPHYNRRELSNALCSMLKGSK